MADTTEPEPTASHKRCERWKLGACRSSSFVQFMLKALHDAGCPVDASKHFVCEPCPVANTTGAFDASRNQIVLCEDALYSESNTADVLTHELMHAFDHCRGHVDFASNIKHLACTEIRAANVSGDCFFLKEFFNRLNLKIAGQHQRCVKRRAALSVAAAMDVSKETAMDAVDEVYEVCFRDTTPFDRIP
eukprot:m.101616 g.101616  ORF g.101616 m.101616 type:complete len:190 (-) comp15469_c0_seq2:53-622(-)